jgi:hypothetical protein
MIGLVTACLLFGTLFVTPTIVSGKVDLASRTGAVMFDGPNPYPPIPW